jgi:hypothetical protein
MRRSTFVLIAVLPLLAGLVLSTGCVRKQEPEPAVQTQEQIVERGRYLVTIAGCNDCHSPKVFTENGMEFDQARLLSGHPEDAELPVIDSSLVQPGKWVLMTQDLTAAVGPWGVSFAANLTPDEETGIGAWSELAFINALRSGKHMGSGRPILPPMPWFNMAMTTDEDLEAMFAYLQSIPPIKNHVPAPIPPSGM